MQRIAFATLLAGFTCLTAPALAATKVESPATSSETKPPKADSDMQVVLDQLAKLGGKPIETLTPAQARKQPSPADAVKALLAKNGKDTAPDPAVATKDISYPAGEGTQKARVYMPVHAKKGKALPVIVYYHGGGWVIADLDTYDATPRALSKLVNAIVVSVEYRHAPEHPFPAAHDDAFAAYQWVLKNAATWGGDAKRVALVGESAGGNLAINTAIKARDNKVQAPLYQALIYPVAGVDMNTPSYQENANAKPLNKAMMGWFVKHTLSKDTDKQDPRIDLVGKADLSNLPPTTIITAEIDPLRSEGEALGKKLEEAGVKVHAKNYEGVTHEFFGMGTVVGDAKAAESAVADDLKDALK